MGYLPEASCGARDREPLGALPQATRPQRGMGSILWSTYQTVHTVWSTYHAVHTVWSTHHAVHTVWSAYHAVHTVWSAYRKVHTVLRTVVYGPYVLHSME